MKKQNAALTQSKMRDVVEMTIRHKRQRNATEVLHQLAREKNVKIVIDAVAQPAQVSWYEGWLRVYHNLYVIFSEDMKKVFGYDMTDGRTMVLEADVVKIELMQRLISSAYKQPVIMEMGIPVMENPDGTSGKCIRLDYKFGAWYVLEILENGHFFYVQRGMTAKLRAYADERGLRYCTNSEDKFASRAKLATVDGKNYWSLRCEGDAGKVFFILYDEETDAFKVTDVAPKIWVLQQRNALKKMKTFAKSHKMVMNGTLPFIASAGGHSAWVMPLVKGGYLACRVRTGEVSYQTELSDSLKLQMRNGEQFVCSLCGFDFAATAWYEAEHVVPEFYTEKV